MDIFKKRISVNKEIKSLLTDMKTVDSGSEEYAKMAKNLETLCSANEKNSKNRMAFWGTALGVAGSLAGIVAIIYSEETRIMTSKALGFVIKGRV